jgi:hypothetical protein
VGLRHDKPSIDVDRLPGNVGGIIRSKKAHQSRNVFGVPPAFKGNSLNPFFHQFARLIITEKLPSMLVPAYPCEKPLTQIPRANASLVTARIAAFIPDASPPLVSTPRRFIGIVARAGRPLLIPLSRQFGLALGQEASAD